MPVLFLLQQAISRAADSFPEHEAIRFAGSALTYGELERRSNSLAHVLVDAGVQRGDRVGIYANKCLELAIAIYGILKAGATYVPLDPSAPVPRLLKIVRHCGIRDLVTENGKRKNVERLQAAGAALRCCIGFASGDDPAVRCVPWDVVSKAPAERPPHVRATELDLAYVLYTSGSTGDPKGIMHTHRSALSFAEVAATAYGFRRDDRISNHAPLHFDLSTLDYFATAVAGATTIVIPEEYTKLPASLSQMMAEERITVFYSVPFALIQLLLNGAVEQRDLRSLRWVLFGGEPFPTKHLRRLMALLPNAQFCNIYGPTETNGCTHFVVPKLSENSDEPIPIGTLYDNADALVVDAEDRPVTPGEIGELLIHSPTRMRGYWGQADLTERSTYRRFAAGGHAELFHRTGDLVELQRDGNFRFAGRKDRQIKTRGHRVELDEIEAALLAHNAVEEAAAYALPDDAGSQRIEASIVLRPRQSGDADTQVIGAADVRQHVRRQLPAYAVPTRIDVVESFPRTATGKIHRRQLRARALEAARNGFEQPRVQL